LLVLLGLFLGPIFPTMQKFGTQHLASEEKGLFNAGIYAADGLFITLLTPVMTELGSIQIQFIFIPTLISAVLILGFLPWLGKVAKK
jgi:fucose permease